MAREKLEHVGRVARQATLQRGVEKVATTICTPLMEMTVKTLKKQLTVRRSASRKKRKISSDKCVIIECGEQSLNLTAHG